MSILDIKIHESWKPFLTTEVRDMLEKIESTLGDSYTPDEHLVLRFMQQDIANIKVVILGQDPYKPMGVANGRAFQPNNLTNWSSKFRQGSLKNIVRAVYAATNNIENYLDIPMYSGIVGEIYLGKFGIKQPREWFDSLENQGVLFLNTALTCKIGESNSHKELWSGFTSLVIKYLDRPNIVWFLWGKEAINSGHPVTGKKYESRHPMLCSATYKDDFLRNKCFKDTANIINWLG